MIKVCVVYKMAEFNSILSTFFSIRKFVSNTLEIFCLRIICLSGKNKFSQANN